MEKRYIPIVLGTTHIGRESEKAAQYIYKELSRVESVETEIVDTKDFNYGRTIPSWEESTEADVWREKAKRADGYVVVVPEYNRGYPGEFKLLWDSAYDEYDKKPVLLCGVSGGGFGGVRVVESLFAVMHACGAVPTSSPMYFSKIKKAFDTEGNPTDPKQNERTKESFDDLFWFADTLKKGRLNF